MWALNDGCLSWLFAHIIVLQMQIPLVLFIKWPESLTGFFFAIPQVQCTKYWAYNSTSDKH
jgi:hypothetical protein